MAILTHVCPHCLTVHIGLRVAAVTTINSNDYVLHLECPKCHMPSGARLAPSRDGFSNSFMQHHGDVCDLGWTVNAFWPDAPAPIIPELIPPDVERIYLQAERNFPIIGNEEAAGTMYRKALDISLKKIDPSLTGMLGQKIKKLAEAGKLTSDIATWSDAIRDIGNDAAHEESPISREELEELRNFSEMVLRYLFSLPNSVRKRRGETLDWES